MSKEKKTKSNSKFKSNLPVIKTVIGVIFVFAGLILSASFISYIFNWENDQSQLNLLDRTVEAENIFGKLGAWLGDFFINQGVGISAIFLGIFLIIAGLKIILPSLKLNLSKIAFHFLFFTLWLPLLFGFAMPEETYLSGRMGFEMNDFLSTFIGNLGIILLLSITFLLYVILEWRVTPEKISNKLERRKTSSYNNGEDYDNDSNFLSEEEKQEREKEKKKVFNKSFTGKTITDEELEPRLKSETNSKNNDASSKNINLEVEQTPTEPQMVQNKSTQTNNSSQALQSERDNHGNSGDIALTVEPVEEEPMVSLSESKSNDLVEKHGLFDPKLELPRFQLPTLELLKDYSGGQNVTIDQRELEANKNKIVETLNNYKIGIDSIKATIGPTVTLYEIIPEAGIRISKIKNLEDDIALSLSALGIRIIAPIPGKGTIGIEVPNSHPTMVSMRSVLASQKYQSAKMDLPIAFGKTISNETFVADLAKMPHLLMAGATGQGKSVGINAIISSLLYKKHPSELKFVMVDPKKVELALYNKIERHYLAKLPDSEDAIITDNTKVINTLNSLCIEMDDRYNLLKDAYVRNIKEYNNKFVNRKLNPENGHRYMPYIVLVVDEFADLIMTAGKEVEAPIARLAQLARAVGIHLIIATQRPSVNVITGIIKANFPARAAFRVTSKVDSRTILDAGGADQLIGKGDMLYTKGNDLIRLQCAFVDTPEVENIAEFIGSQKGYPDALLLPEYTGDNEGSPLDLDPNDRDELFEDAARIIIAAQQGSASLLQRKLKIGYNRAGRIIDQLEVNGIVGPFEGSKAREVLIQDEMSLEQLLKND